MVYQKLNEHDLMQMREALAEPTVAKAISATEQVLASLGYAHPEDNIPGKKVNMELKTRVFEFCNGKYRNLPELAQAMGIAVSQLYRVKQGKRHIGRKFITGAVKAFPGYKLDDLFYAVPDGSENAEIGPRLGINRERARQIVKSGLTSQKPNLRSKVMLTSSDVAQFLGVHPNTVRHWSNKGILKSYHIGPRGDRRFQREDLDNLLKE